MATAVKVTKRGVFYQNVPDPTAEELKASEDNLLSFRSSSAKERRNGLLAESDWTQAVDSALTTEKKAEWATYRTSLRDLPTHENWPDLEDGGWPTKPS